MEDKLSMRVSIADKYYPLKVGRNEEERIRKAAKIINDKLLRYKKAYSVEKIDDFMAMITLDFATRYLELEEKMNQSSTIEKLEDLNDEINNHIDNLDLKDL